MAKSELFRIVNDVIDYLGYDAYIDDTLGYRLPLTVKFKKSLKPSQYVDIAMEIEDGIKDGYDINVDVEPTMEEDEITIDYVD